MIQMPLRRSDSDGIRGPRHVIVSTTQPSNCTSQQPLTRLRAALTVQKGAAREHLEWLSARGIVEPIDGRPKQYQRNHAYFEWVRANELRREHTDAELETKLSGLVAEEQAYREQYGVADPGQIDALAEADYDSLETVWEDIGDWKTIRRDLRIIERARKDRDTLDGAGIVG